MSNHKSCGYQINEKIEDLERQVRALTKQNQELKDIIEKAVCENDSQGVYEKCNIAGKYSENTKGIA